MTEYVASLGQVCGSYTLPSIDHAEDAVGPALSLRYSLHRTRDGSRLSQAAISSNVANANTPGYKAQDIEPFNKLLDAKVVAVTVTSPMHIATGTSDAGARDARRRRAGKSSTPATPSAWSRKC